MEWQDNYNVGITSIDKQHQKLFHMINKLEKSMNSDTVCHTMGEILKDLVDYVKFHFEDEEKIMSRIGYPELEQQKTKHKELIDRVVNILQDLKHGENVESVDLYVFLKNWFVGHILEEDKKIGDYFFQ
ncbi:MAG TPA: bacteriohemerythrin [Desulfobacterales bacterium]|nr:bacteriohemerythrin [Desulfobacterales bacterium]